MQTKAQTVAIHDQQLYVQWLGQRCNEDPTIVFLHEGLGSVEQWRDFPRLLCEATGFSGMLYDRHGYGQSSTLEGSRDVDYLEYEGTVILPSLLDTLSLKQTILVGHSDGASIALHAASKQLAAILGVVSEAAHVHLDERSINGIKLAKQNFEHGRLKRALSRYHGDNTDGAFYGWADVWLSPEFRQWNFHDRLKQIQCPVLVIQGQDDEYGMRGQVDAILNNVQGDKEELFIKDCGHCPHQEQQQLVLERCQNFIEKLPLR